MPQRRHPIAWLFLTFWALLLFASIGFKLSSKLTGWPRWEDFVIMENRPFYRRPDFRSTPVREWGAAMDRWYNDNFAWRSRILQFYRYVHIYWLRTSIGRTEVPGRDGWVFRKGGDWAELEDYLGAFELTPEEIGRWVELFEGRQQWAEAHGVHYLEVITPVKAQIHPEKLFPMIARHRGQGVREQVQAALAGSPARDHVLFITDLIARVTRTQTVFYASDHHLNGYGTYLLFQAINEALAARLGPMTMPPFYPEPRPAVAGGAEAGCFQKGRPGYEKLFVSVPGMRNDASSPAVKRGGKYPYVNVVLTQPGARRTLVLAHDSFLRYPLSSWNQGDPLLLPVADGFDRILSILFKRLKTRELDHLVSVEQPAVIVEQFPEIKLNQEVVGLDDTMRQAAAFGRARPWREPDPPPAGTPLQVRVILEQVTDPSGTWTDMRNGRGVPEITVELVQDGRVLASLITYPGPRRALFFPSFPAPGAPLEVRLRGGHGRVAGVELRTPSTP